MISLWLMRQLLQAVTQTFVIFANQVVRMHRRERGIVLRGGSVSLKRFQKVLNHPTSLKR